MASPASPLLGSWPSTAGVNIPGMPPPVATPAPVPIGSSTKGGDLYQTKNLTKASDIQNLTTGNLRNQLIPLFSNLATGYGGGAGNFFAQLANLGSPFYQKKQQQTFEQGSKAEQEAGAKSREQLSAAGAGYTPSGVGAGMFGGEAQAAAGNQEEAFLNNLFQNEQLQLAGASGLAQLAGLFNPSGLFGMTSQNPPTGQGVLQNFDALASGIGALFGGSSFKGPGGGTIGIGGG